MYVCIHECIGSGRKCIEVRVCIMRLRSDVLNDVSKRNFSMNRNLPFKGCSKTRQLRRIFRKQALWLG